MATTNAKNAAFVRHDRATELWDAESVVQVDLVADVLFHVEEVN